MAGAQNGAVWADGKRQPSVPGRLALARAQSQGGTVRLPALCALRREQDLNAARTSMPAPTMASAGIRACTRNAGACTCSPRGRTEHSHYPPISWKRPVRREMRSEARPAPGHLSTVAEYPQALQRHFGPSGAAKRTLCRAGSGARRGALRVCPTVPTASADLGTGKAGAHTASIFSERESGSIVVLSPERDLYSGRLAGLPIPESSVCQSSSSPLNGCAIGVPEQARDTRPLADVAAHPGGPPED